MVLCVFLYLTPNNTNPWVYPAVLWLAKSNSFSCFFIWFFIKFVSIILIYQQAQYVTKMTGQHILMLICCISEKCLSALIYCRTYNQPLQMYFLLKKIQTECQLTGTQLNYPLFFFNYYKNYCKILIFVSWDHWIQLMHCISPVGHQYLTMQVILTLQKLCKHLKEISVYISLLPKHQCFDPMSTYTVDFAKAVIT